MIDKQARRRHRIGFDFNLSCKERHKSCGRSKGIFACFAAVALPLVSQVQAANWRKIPGKVYNRRIMRPIMRHLRVPSKLNSSSIARINKIGPRFD